MKHLMQSLYSKPLFLTFCLLNVKVAFISIFLAAFFSANESILKNDFESSQFTNSGYEHMAVERLPAPFLAPKVIVTNMDLAEGSEV